MVSNATGYGIIIECSQQRLRLADTKRFVAELPSRVIKINKHAAQNEANTDLAAFGRSASLYDTVKPGVSGVWVARRLSEDGGRRDRTASLGGSAKVRRFVVARQDH
ncbi:hypothetical protein E4U22_001723 [Claviceps purpurea]|nr:hypothetical protein E4U22_001723 [Claviceps purpurea]